MKWSPLEEVHRWLFTQNSVPPRPLTGSPCGELFDAYAHCADRRDLDTLAKLDGSWYFAERKLILDWSETRVMTAPAAA
jgi:hypothetical protein